MLLLIQTLENDPQAAEFRHPVDYVRLGLLDYPSIVRQPMDLSTVKVSTGIMKRAKKKVKAGKYETLDEALADIQLIWDNCMTYNQQDSVCPRRVDDRVVHIWAG